MNNMFKNCVYVWVGLITLGMKKQSLKKNKELISKLWSKSLYLYDVNTFSLIAKYDRHQDIVKELKMSSKTVIKYKNSGKVLRNKYIISYFPLSFPFSPK